MIDIKVSNVITLNKRQSGKRLSSILLHEIREKLTFDNPKYVTAKKYGYSTYKLPEKLTYYLEDDDKIVLPKGFLDTLTTLIQDTAETPPNRFSFLYVINDNTYKSPETIYGFTKELWPYEKRAVDVLMNYDMGILQAGCGAGKTITALALLAQRKQHTIILVHTKDLMDQWINNIHDCLAIPKRYIGIIGAGKNKISPITVGMIQTLTKRDIPMDYFGMVIQDEVHHIAAETFINTIVKLNCRYQLGLSATPKRKDGLSKLLSYYIGDIRHIVPDEELIKYKKTITPKIVIKKTDFFTKNSDDFTWMISDMTQDKARNRLIVKDICKEANKGNNCLVLSHRVEHCSLLKDILREKGIHCLHIHGKSLRRKELMQKIKDEKVNVLIATRNLAGEGLDIPALNRLFLVTPNNAAGGKLKQYIGRIARVAKGKKDAIVYDYVDHQIGNCWGMYLSRRKLYNEIT